MQSGKISFIRIAAGALLAGSCVLAACDAPTAPGKAAVAEGASLLLSPACAGTGGQTHSEDTISTAQVWTRANSPHRVTDKIVVAPGGRITIAPGSVVCFSPFAALYVRGGRMIARGRDTAQIVFTARDPAYGWWGLQFSNSANGSYLTNVRIEHVALNSIAVAGEADHPVYIDSAVIRQSGMAVSLSAPGSYISRSRVDTTTNRNLHAVRLSNGARFEQTVVRRAAGVGMTVVGNVALLGGRIEGSGGTGLVFTHDIAPSKYFKPVRVVGGRGYPISIPASVLARTYSTPALQDSLLGNARDTVVITGGVLRHALTVGPRLPLLVTADVFADSGAILTAQPGASFAFWSDAGLRFQKSGRLLSRGTQADPVLFTAEDPARGWRGLWFHGTVSSTSYVTNSRVEHVSFYGIALWAREKHRLIVDSTVIRLAGTAVVMESPNSRLSRTRVDTTLNVSEPAVTLGSNARLESTLVRNSSGNGIYIASPGVVVVSCDVRNSVYAGIIMYTPVPVHDCNLVDNGDVGIHNYHLHNADVRGNWWGSAGGPNGAGGDGVAGSTIVSPWRTTPYVLPYVP
jgi:hypothetical protein